MLQTINLCKTTTAKVLATTDHNKYMRRQTLLIYSHLSARSKRRFIHHLKSVVEEVLNLHFDEIELVVVLKSLNVGKYFDKILGNMPPPQ